MKRRDAICRIPALGCALAAASGFAAGKKATKPLAVDYLDQVAGLFKKIRATELDNMLEAAYQVARVKQAGSTCFCQWETGHSFDGDMFPDRPGDTDIFALGYTMGDPGIEPRAGDLLMVNVLREPLEDPHKKGMFVVGGATPWCGDTARSDLLTERNRQLLIRKYADIWIEPYITTWGGLIWLPGEIHPLGPTSGALGMVTYWPVVADAARILARAGHPVSVKGSGTTLGADSSRLPGHQPLGEAYLDECVSQTGQIRAELGTIRAVADAIADRILDGGRLWVYSRHHEALSAEANAKRSGLALINTTWADDDRFDGTKNDIMIMGIYQPDDEVDLAMIEKYKKLGMTVAAIGPNTRGGRIPDGRTVPGMADFQMGNMCDTDGLFAIEGLDKAVCPTSGLMVNLMFWTTMIELAEQIMARTGNTPAVLSTGAIIGGGDQRRLRTDLARTRGY